MSWREALLGAAKSMTGRQSVPPVADRNQVAARPAVTGTPSSAPPQAAPDWVSRPLPKDLYHAPAPSPAKPQTPVKQHTSPTSSAADERARAELTIKGARAFRDQIGVVPRNMRAFLAGLHEDNVQDLDRLRAHPGFSNAFYRIFTRLNYDTLTADDQQTFRCAIEADWLADFEADTFENPNDTIFIRDTRMRKVNGDRFLDLKWEAEYTRIAGTMDDRERFVFLWGTANGFLGLLSPEEVLAYQICALWGDGKGDVEWELDPTYVGDKETDFLAKAKERYEPDKVSKGFETAAWHAMRIIEVCPDSPLGQWSKQKLRPHSSGWASGR